MTISSKQASFVHQPRCAFPHVHRGFLIGGYQKEIAMSSVMARVVAGLGCFGLAVWLFGVLPNPLTLGGWIHGYYETHWIPAHWWEMGAVATTEIVAMVALFGAGYHLIRSAGRVAANQ